MLESAKNKIMVAFPSLYFLGRRIIGNKEYFEFPEEPWINNQAKEWLDTRLNKDSVVFEYGSGGSTIYIAKRAKFVFSVEHIANWYAQLLQKLRKDKIANCKVFFAPSQKGIKEGFMSGDTSLSHINFEKYVKKISSFPDQYFDLVIVDGRARNSCVRLALPKVKNGGCILLDNSDRPEYKPVFEQLKDFECKSFSGPVTNISQMCTTTIWYIKRN